MDRWELLLVSLASSAVLLYVCVLAGAVALVAVIHKRESILRAVARRHERLCRALREKGGERRRRLVLATQRRNLKELAALVRGRLKAHRRHIAPWAYHAAESLARQAVRELRFEELHALHELLAGRHGEELSRELERFLQQEK